MVRRPERPAERGQAPRGANEAVPPLSEDVAAALRDLQHQLEAWVAELGTLGRLRMARMRHGALEGLMGTVLVLGALLGGAAALASASILSVRGVAGALAVATGSRWLGDLLGGLISLIAIVGSVWLMRALLRRRELARLRERLGDTTTGAADRRRAPNGAGRTS